MFFVVVVVNDNNEDNPENEDNPTNLDNPKIKTTTIMCYPEKEVDNFICYVFAFYTTKNAAKQTRQHARIH